MFLYAMCQSKESMHMCSIFVGACVLDLFENLTNTINTRQNFNLFILIQKHTSFNMLKLPQKSLIVIENKGFLNTSFLRLRHILKQIKTHDQNENNLDCMHHMQGKNKNNKNK